MGLWRRTATILVVIFLLVASAAGGVVTYKGGIKWFGQWWSFRTEGKTFARQLQKRGVLWQFTDRRPQLARSFRVWPDRPSSAGKKIVDFVRAQLGEPYVFGSAGPDSWDCSGLILVAVSTATDGRVQLPHFAATQAKMGQPVELENIKPGDGVYFGSPVGHAGIYVGDGLFIAAPQTGDVVKVSVLADRSDLVAIRRFY